MSHIFILLNILHRNYFQPIINLSNEQSLTCIAHSPLHFPSSSIECKTPMITSKKVEVMWPPQRAAFWEEAISPLLENSCMFSNATTFGERGVPNPYIGALCPTIGDWQRQGRRTTRK